MKVLSIVSQKDGTDKTTLATHLSVEAERNGQTTALIDLDPQASALSPGTLNNAHASVGFSPFFYSKTTKMRTFRPSDEYDTATEAYQESSMVKVAIEEVIAEEFCQDLIAPVTAAYEDAKARILADMD